MISEPRTVNLLTELIHIPSKHSPEALRQVYNTICTSCGYENFMRTPDGARIDGGQLEGNQVSTVTFRQDRMQMAEEHGSMSVAQYIRKVEVVARTSMDILRIPIFLVQQSTVRSIVSPNCFNSAAEFLSQTLFRIEPADVEPLGRPTNIIGLRMLFPPTKKQLQKFNVRIECYLKDPRSIYIENVATFQAPIQHQNLEAIGKNLESAAEFVSTNICTFLSRFDRKDPKL